MKNKSLKTYASLARIGFPRSYSGKIMLVVFAGTHLPLVVLVLYLLLATPGGLRTHWCVLAALLIATIIRVMWDKSKQVPEWKPPNHPRDLNFQ